MATKIPAKKAAKAVSKVVEPATKKVTAAKTASSSTAKKAAGKSSASVSVAKKTVAAKSAAAKSAPKPASKAAAVKSVPAGSDTSTPASRKAAPAKKTSKSTPAPTVKNPVPVSKTPAKSSSKTAASAKPAATRPVGKVAVAVTSKPAAPIPRSKYKVVEYKTDEATGRPILPKGYKPGPDEEYMSTLQQEYFRQRLLQWRADLVEESKQTIENLREEVRDIGDEAERATRETENSLELRTRDRYRKLIGKIDSTLKRVDAGDYGYCVDTGEEIGLDRLEARLTAERTIDAQERWEHMQKQQGD